MRRSSPEKTDWRGQFSSFVCPASGLFGLLIAVAVVASLAGCDLFGSSVGDAPDELSFEAASSSLFPGDEVRAELTNGLDRSVAYNLCLSLNLERRHDGAWKDVPVSLAPDEDYACPAISYELEPGESAGTVAYLPKDLAPGTYRLATEVEVGFDGEEDRRKVVTNTFKVLAVAY